MKGHEFCREVLRSRMADQGIEVTASTVPPLIPTPYDQRALTCPHGERFYLAPTSEQIAEWARDGVA